VMDRDRVVMKVECCSPLQELKETP
jgi:hypothetical protein